jgi:hypothetical protein
LSEQYLDWGTRKPRGLSPRLVILIVIFFAANVVASAQSIPSARTTERVQLATLDQPDEFRYPSPVSLFTPLKLESLSEHYEPITPRQSLRWFIASTIGPPHVAAEVFLLACGTGLDRPKEYGPHWGGFADRLGIGMAGSATANAIEASAGLIFREDPRYFRVPEQPLKARIGNVARLTFAARDKDGNFGPAYARYVAIVATNLLSNTWRAHSEANTQDALLRASAGFTGRMAANAFQEFWPDVKRGFRKH